MRRLFRSAALACLLFLSMAWAARADDSTGTNYLCYCGSGNKPPECQLTLTVNVAGGRDAAVAFCTDKCGTKGMCDLTPHSVSAIEYECICGYAPTFAQCSTVTNDILHTGFKKSFDSPPKPSKECSDACDAKGHSGEECYVGWLAPDVAAPNSNERPGGAGTTQLVGVSPLSMTLPLGTVSLSDVIARVIKQLLSVVGALALAFFVWGGLRWMLARGAPDETAKAKKILVAAVSGLVAIFASYAVLNLIINAISK